MSKNNEVGYRKPPKHTRFKKGQSGNPKGRPKGSKNMRTILNELLNRTMVITEKGRKRTVKFMEAYIHQMAAKALNGSTRDQIQLLKMVRDFAPDLFREIDPPKEIVVRFIEAKDGRPASAEASGSDSETAETA